MQKTILCLGAMGMVTVVGCGASGPDCPGGATTCVSIGSGTSAADIEKKFATLTDGSTVVFGEGTFAMNDTIIIAANNVTVIGAGMGKTIFDFSGQKGGDGEGFFAQSVQNITLQNFTVRDTLGNAVKVLGSTGVRFDHLETTWTSDDAASHGGYGLYPVLSKNVVIANCVASGASDSGIYLGQSDHAVIHDNEVHDNVAGIEVENTWFVDVHDNYAHDNTGGILVFALPGLQQMGTHDIRVFKNRIESNNTPSFAAPGNTVGLVPRGTGFLVMAATNVEFFGNTLATNETGNSAIISYYATQIPISDQTFNPLPNNVSLHDNTFTGGGDIPDLTKQFGLLLASAQSAFPGNVVPSLMWDGIQDPQTASNICYANDGDAKYVDLHLDQVDPQNPNLPAVMSVEAPPAGSCTPLAPVTFAGSDK
jgi:parallel beta-helix repeat protein